MRLAGIALVGGVFMVGTAYGGENPREGASLRIRNPPSGSAANRAAVTATGGTFVFGNAEADPFCTGDNMGGTSSIRFIATGGAGDVTIHCRAPDGCVLTLPDSTAMTRARRASESRSPAGG